MKRSTRKVKWQHRGKDYAVGMIVERGKSPLIVVKFRKDSDIRLAIDTVPSSQSEPASAGPMFQPPAESAEAFYESFKRKLIETMSHGQR